MAKIVTFLYEVKAELTKVSWPSKDELIGAATIVCILVIIFAIILGGMDAGFSALIRRMIQ